MDPFEEFEFKPITEGLGFHKKAKTTEKPLTFNKPEETRPFSKDEPKSLFKTTSSMNQLKMIEEEPNKDLLKSPLPRKNTASKPLVETPSTAAVDEILKSLKNKRHLDFDNSTQKNLSKTAPVAKTEFSKTTVNLAAGLLDSMLVLAASLICMIILLVITKADLIKALSTSDADPMILIATFGLFATVAFIYYVVNRTFVGFTPGEWAFDQRMGTPEQSKEALFPLKIAARSAVVIFTGFVILPLISFFLNSDLAGAITGASLFRKN